MKIDNTDEVSVFIWEVIEKLVCRATHFDRQDSTLIDTLERYTDKKFKCLLNASPREVPVQKVQSSSPPMQITQPPPPPPLPPPFFSGDLKTKSTQGCDHLENKNGYSDNQQIPGNFFFIFHYVLLIKNHFIFKTLGANHQLNQSISLKVSFSNLSQGNNSSPRLAIQSTNNEKNSFKLPQQCVPKAQVKMKQLIWSKIQPDRVIGKQSIWTKFNQSTHEIQQRTFFQGIEDFFKTSENPRAEQQSKDPTLKETKNWHSSAEKINLLDSKRSLNINIFLKQFRCSPDEIIQLLWQNAHQKLGLENLEGMLKILPDPTEIELLKVYQGDIVKLGEAEKFLFKLIHVKNYKIRIESLLLKAEFDGQMAYFNKTIENINKAAEAIYTNVNLARILLLICQTGNFINDVIFIGNNFSVFYVKDFFVLFY